MLSGCQTAPPAADTDAAAVTTVTASPVSGTTTETGSSTTVTMSTTVATTDTTTAAPTSAPTTVPTVAQVTTRATTVYTPPTTVATAPPTTTRPTVPVGIDPSGVCLAAEYVDQRGFPTGCESASTTMLLRYWGVDITLAQFVDNYLDKGEIRHTSGGTYAPHPADKFVGDPRSPYAYGCFAPVIVRAINKCLPAGLQVVNETGSSLSSLCREYIDNGMPFIIWATNSMEPARKGDTWILETTGETFQWWSVEHCLLLIGYDQNNYYFLDTVADGFAMYPRAAVEARFAQMGYQAVAIRPIPTTTVTTATTTTTTVTTTTTETTAPPTETTTVTAPTETPTTTAPSADETLPTESAADGGTTAQETDAP